MVANKPSLVSVALAASNLAFATALLNSSPLTSFLRPLMMVETSVAKDFTPSLVGAEMMTPKRPASEYGSAKALADDPGILSAAMESGEVPGAHLREEVPPRTWERTWSSGVEAEVEPYAMIMVGCARPPAWASKGIRCSPPKYLVAEEGREEPDAEEEPKAEPTALVRASAEIPVPMTARLDLAKAC